jgi:hypothetical protein
MEGPTKELLNSYTEDVLRKIGSTSNQHRAIIRKELCYIAFYMSNESDWPNDEEEFESIVHEHISPHFRDTDNDTLVRLLIIAGINMWSIDASVDELYDELYGHRASKGNLTLVDH